MAPEQTPCTKIGDVQLEGAVIEKWSIIKKSNCLAVGIQDTKLSSSFLSPNYCKQTSGSDQDFLLSFKSSKKINCFSCYAVIYKRIISSH